MTTTTTTPKPKKKQATNAAPAPSPLADATTSTSTTSAPKTTKTTTKKASAAKKPNKTQATARVGDAATVLGGRRVAFFGEFSSWPTHHHARPHTLAARLGALVVTDEEAPDAAVVDERLDVLVLGDLRGTDRADAKKRGEKLAAAGSLTVLDEAAYRELVRVDVKGKRFALIGGFDFSPDEASDRLLARMAENVGGVVVDDIDASLDYVVVGARRGDKKQARVNVANKLLAEKTATFTILDEQDFLGLVRSDAPLSVSASSTPSADGTSSSSMDFASFLGRVTAIAEAGRLARAMKMLKAESFKLYNKLDDDRLVGVVKSQTGSGEVYAPWLKSNGSFGCCTQHLDECMGVGAGGCKHLLVLVLGLVRTNTMPAERALSWMKGMGKKGATLDADLGAETFLNYKGAEAGTVDWRPTETLPEDFLAL